jgi:mono/diheme cytochrome c family protein
MMPKLLRIIGRVLVGLVALVLLVVAVGFIGGGVKLNKTYDVPARTLVVPTDSASIVRGEALATLSACTACHAGTLAGRIMSDDALFGRLTAPNLTRGNGGVGASYTDADWERAIRHGVRRDGTGLANMPSGEFNQMRDAELGRLIAYLKSVPPVDNVIPPRRVGPLLRIMLMFGAPLLHAKDIDHTSQRVVAPAPAATVEYGKYITAGCQFCHGGNFQGAAVGGSEPGAPPSPSIGQTGNATKWTNEQFIQAMRTGVTPAGVKLRNQYMPWQAIGRLSDDELRGMQMYLSSVPPPPTK